MKGFMKGFRKLLLNKCIMCGKKTKNPSFCSEDCADIYFGDAPRATNPPGYDSPHKVQDPGRDWEDH